MSLKFLLLTYLSPFYFVARVCLLWLALQVWTFGKVILMAFGMNHTLAIVLGAFATAWIVTTAIRPWRIGPSVKDVGQSLEDFRDKFR